MLVEEEGKGEKGLCVHAAVQQEQPERELVLGMWYHYLSQSQARTPRSTVGALYYAPAARAVAYRRAGCRERASE